MIGAGAASNVIVCTLLALSAGSVNANQAVDYKLVAKDVECNSSDVSMGVKGTIQECANAVRATGGANFIFGKGAKKGWCYKELTASSSCPEGWEKDLYDFYSFQAAQAGYSHFADISCNGRNELGLFFGSTVEKCQTRCDSVKDCISFEYFTQNHQKAGLCQLSKSCTYDLAASDCKYDASCKDIDLYIRGGCSTTTTPKAPSSTKLVTCSKKVISCDKPDFDSDTCASKTFTHERSDTSSWSYCGSVTVGGETGSGLGPSYSASVTAEVCHGNEKAVSVGTQEMVQIRGVKNKTTVGCLIGVTTVVEGCTYVRTKSWTMKYDSCDPPACPVATSVCVPPVSSAASAVALSVAFAFVAAVGFPPMSSGCL